MSLENLTGYQQEKLCKLKQHEFDLYFAQSAPFWVMYQSSRTVVFHSRAACCESRKRVFTLEPAFMTQKTSFLSLPEYGRSPTNELSGAIDHATKMSSFLTLPEFGRASKKQGSTSDNFAFPCRPPCRTVRTHPIRNAVVVFLNFHSN